MPVRPGVFKSPTALPWLPMAAQMQQGGMEWKLLDADPDHDRWTVMYRGPAGAVIMPHVHEGEAEGYLFYGALTTGDERHAAKGEGFIREPAQAHHPRTRLLEATCFLLTMDGPIRWLLPEGGEKLQTPAEALKEWSAQLQTCQTCQT